MELKITHVYRFGFTVQDQHGCYLDRVGNQVLKEVFVTGPQAIEIVRIHVEAQS